MRQEMSPRNQKDEIQLVKDQYLEGWIDKSEVAARLAPLLTDAEATSIAIELEIDPAEFNGLLTNARSKTPEPPKQKRQRAEKKPKLALVNPDERPASPDAQQHPTYTLVRTDKGAIVRCVENIVSVLTYDQRWRGIIAKNEFTGTTEMRRSPPWHPDDAPSVVSPGEWTEQDTIRLQAWLGRYLAFRPTRQMVDDAVSIVAARSGFHPIREYLSGLKWDGKPRLDRWLTDHFGVTHNEYSKMVGKCSLISAVARVFEPGCLAKYVLILEGPQDLGKSRSIRALAGAEWFKDTPPDLSSKDGRIALRGVWIYELAELDGLNRHDAATIKAYISSPTDNFRPPYERREITAKRQNIFIGTVNSVARGYLKDETGGVRFWPVLVTKADAEGLARERDQLWAEAVHRYNAGERWWPEGDENAHCVAEQEARYDVDARETRIANWLESDAAAAKIASGLTLADVLEHALGIDPYRMNKASQTAVGSIMSRLGWKVVREGGGKRQRVYRRPTS